MSTTELPIAVIGSGPVGLAAAAQILSHGGTPVVFEAGDDVADGVRAWGPCTVAALCARTATANWRSRKPASSSPA